MSVVPVIGLLAPVCAAQGQPTSPPATPHADTDSVVVDDKTEAIIKGALKYLASQQRPGGFWNDYGEAGQHPVALTGYAMVAFMATGNLPGEGEYGRAMTLGTKYLVDHIGSDGYISTQGTNMYDHGIATIVLAEIYGQTRDARLRPGLEKAVQLIISCQNNAGGWRYAPHSADADMSVSVLQIVALRAAKNSGIDVPQQTMDQAVGFIRTCYDKPSGGFTYQPNNHQPGFARTAAGVYCLQVCGYYDDPMVASGSKYLQKYGSQHQQQFYTYGDFYAAPAQYMIGGETWQRWYAGQRDLLVPLARHDGDMVHWDPLDGHYGALYATSVYTTILAMPYHYLPLYQR